MRILLLNDNPVVNKLVTLSAQKTSDELDVVNSIDEIKHNSYDLLVLDDTVYTPEILDKLQEVITYNKSLFIYSKTSKEVPGFTSTLKKPFLPTDLVERFSVMGRAISEAEPQIESEPEILEMPEIEEEIHPLDEFSDFNEDITGLDNEIIDLNEEIAPLEDITDLDEDDELPPLDDVTELPELEDASEEIAPDIKLDENLEDLLDDKPNQEEVLDEEDIKEIQNLLEDTEEVLPDLEENNEPLEELIDDMNELEDVVDDLIEEESEDKLKEPELELEDEELELDESELEDEELELDESELEDEELELDESELEDEELELDEPELEDEELTPIEETREEEIQDKNEEANEEIGLNSLNSRDIKLAIGEEVKEIEETMEETEKTVQEELTPPLKNSDNAVESLKNLLEVLADKNIASSLKGAKISINISFGDE